MGTYSGGHLPKEAQRLEDTPLDLDEAQGLIPEIKSQTELNFLEYTNIQMAMSWAYSQNNLEILNQTFCRSLHKKMFSQVWRWAGEFRHSDKNLGVPWAHIPQNLENLFRDTRYWIENHSYPWSELAARFHHRSVCIHPFPNGNGRHARLMTDLLLKNNGQPMPSWKANNGTHRESYLNALKMADKGEFSPLIQLIESYA